MVRQPISNAVAFLGPRKAACLSVLPEVTGFVALAFGRLSLGLQRCHERISKRGRGWVSSPGQSDPDQS